MPVIPTYTAKGRLTTEAPGVRIPAGGLGREWGAVSELGGALFKLGEKMRGIRREEEKSQAFIESTKRLKELEHEASQDTEVQGWDERYEKRLQDIRSEVSETIKDQRVKAKFQQEFDFRSLSTQYNIKKFGVRRLVDQRKASLAQELEDEQTGIFNATTPLERQARTDKIGTLLQDRAKEGIITYVEAGRMFREIKEDLPIQQAKWDADRDPLGTRERLLKGEYEIGVEDRQSLIKLTEDLEERNIEQAKFALTLERNKLEQQVAWDIASGQIKSVNDIDRFLASDSISLEYAEVAKKLIRSTKKIDPVMKAETYDEISNEFFQLGITKKKVKAGLEDLAKFRLLLMDRLAEGLIDEGTYRKWLKETDDVFGKKLAGRIDRGYEAKKTAFDFFNWWGEKYVAKDKKLEATVYLKQRLIEELEAKPDMPEEEIPVLTNRIIGEFLGISPDVDESGKEYIDADGNRALVYPDGSYRIIDADGTLGELSKATGPMQNIMIGQPKPLRK